MITRSDLKVKIKLLKSETVYAQAEIILFDIWHEKGWKILKSNRPHYQFGENIWIQAPCFRVGNQWKEIVFIENREIYELVQEVIYDAYHMAKYKSDGEEGVNEVDTNPEGNKGYEITEEKDLPF
jgi:hypothetical protein